MSGPVPPSGWERPIERPAGGWSGQPLASWGSRLGALLIDGLILTVPAAALAALVIALLAGSDADAIVVAILGFLAYLVAALFYAPLLMARGGRANGQTWGKQLLGIRVIRDSGEPMSFGWAALREVAVKGIGIAVVGTVLPVIGFLVNYLWPLWDDENRALHDMVVATHVVRA